MEKPKRDSTQSLRAHVYAELKADLMKGSWKAGDKLPSENALSSRFGVSRVTVRAALQQLSILGLVEAKQGGGTYVRDFSAIDTVGAFHPLMQVHRNQDLITVLEYRKIVEKGTVGIAAGKATEKDISGLEENYSTMLSLIGNPEPYARADLEFHISIARISRNPIVLKVYRIIDGILSAAMADIVKLLGPELGIGYHKAIIEALKRGNKVECEALMEEHIDTTIQAILREEQEGRNAAERPE